MTTAMLRLSYFFDRVQILICRCVLFAKENVPPAGLFLKKEPQKLFPTGKMATHVAEPER
jgi:hypothetical protein